MCRSERIDEFMQRALHHPERGYYARRIRGIGNRGDFTTAAQLSQAPAKAISAWLQEGIRREKIFHVIEIGPGLGTLSEQILGSLPFWLRFRVHFHLVESSSRLQSLQKERLGKKVTYHSTIHSALERSKGQALLFSNELVDAFPARVFEKKQGKWLEIGIEEQGGVFREFHFPEAELPSSSVFSYPYREGQRVEVHDSYRMWLETWLPLWKKGRMMTIDYGDRLEKLYPSKPRGSLRAYLLQQRLEGMEVYQNQGFQDLTADVNFTDLELWSKPWLETESYSDFSEWIRPYVDASEERFLLASSYFRLLIQKPIYA